MNKETLETLLKSATPEVITKYAMQIVEAGTKIVAVRPHVVKVRESSENILAKSDDLAFAFTTITDALKAQFGADLAKADESVKKAVTEATATITALGKAAEEMTTQMDDVEGSVEDAAAAAGDETDKGLNAAATAKKRYDRQFLAHKRETDRQLDQMRKAQELSTVTILGGIEKMLTASLGAPAAVAAPASGAPTAVITKSEDGAQGETVQKQAPTGVPAANVEGKVIKATDAYGMPNPDYIASLTKGDKDGGSAFIEMAKLAPAQQGDPWPKNGDGFIQRPN